MPGEIRTLGKHSLIYGTGIIIGKLASFIMLPVYTRYLTPVDYGVLDLLGMMIDIVGMVAGLGFVSGLYKYYAEAPDGETKAEVMSTAFIGAITFALVSGVLGFLAARPLNGLVLGASGAPAYVRLFFVIYVLQALENVPLALLRARNRSVLFVAVNTGRLLSMLSFNVFFVVVLGAGVRGVMISSIISETLVSGFLTIYFLRQIGLRFSRRQFDLLLRFGRPMVLWSLSSFVLVFSDRFFLKHYTGTAAVGIYSLAYQFAFVLSALAFSPFQTVWDPRRFEIAKHPDAQHIYGRVFLYLNIVLGLAGAGIGLFVHDFLRLMAGQAFRSASQVVPLLVAAQIVFTWSDFCNLGIYLRGDSRVLGKVALVTGVATLGLNFLLVPPLGIWGATLATCGAYALRFVLVYRSAQAAFHIRYDWRGVVELYGLLAAAVLIRHAALPLRLVASVPLTLALFATCIALVYTRILEPAERQALVRFCRDGVERVRATFNRSRRVPLPAGDA